MTPGDYVVTLSNYRCKNCGRESEDHKARTHNCPMSRGQFAHFHPSQTFEPDTSKPTRRKPPRVVI